MRETFAPGGRARAAGRRRCTPSPSRVAAGQAFARSHGARAGGSDGVPSGELDAATIFAPVAAALAATGERRDGRVRGYPHERHSGFPYRLLWEERKLCSVANLTRRDGEEFMAVAPQIPVRTTTVAFPLAEINEALGALRTAASRAPQC